MYFILNDNENLRINCTQYTERVTKESYDLSIVTCNTDISDFENIVDLDTITSIEFFSDDNTSIYRTTRYTEIDDCMKLSSSGDVTNSVYLCFKVLR